MSGLLHKALLAVAAVLATACSNLVEVRPLATGRVEVSAYELRGAELSILRRETQRLCPTGADVLRQAARDQQPSDPAGRWQAWMNRAATWVDPPQREAQMVVVCKPTLDALTVAAAPASPPAAPTPDPSNDAPIPTGPIWPSW